MRNESIYQYLLESIWIKIFQSNEQRRKNNKQGQIVPGQYLLNDIPYGQDIYLQISINHTICWIRKFKIQCSDSKATRQTERQSQQIDKSNKQTREKQTDGKKDDKKDGNTDCKTGQTKKQEKNK